LKRGGATGSEVAVAVLITVVFAGVVLVHHYVFGNYATRWPKWELAIIGLDIAVGLFSMIWASRRARRKPLPAAVLAAAQLHPIFVVIFFGDSFIAGYSWYLALIGAAALVDAVRGPWASRGVAGALLGVFVLVNVLWVPVSPGFEWLMPYLLVKVVLMDFVRGGSVRRAL
ncbi:MAG: hypothetical protein WA989_07325, partial [Henriciella sp.]